MSPSRVLTRATSSIDSWRAANGFVRKPRSRSHSSVSECDAKSRPSAAPTPYAQSASGRDAVTDESFCRSEPAAALRGFGVVFFPSAASRSLSARKPDSGM